MLERFGFVADKNVFVDAYLVFSTENGYKGKSRKSTTICCGFCTNETTTYGGILCLEIVLSPQGMKNPRFWDRGWSYKSVLFLDELPEYSRATLETLRQPLEDGVITVSRASGTYEYPANFMMIASMNPCPCGNYGSRDLTCTCSPSAIQNYLKKISGPLLDRIDLKIDVERVEFADLASKTNEESSDEIKKRVDRARQIQNERFKGTSIHTNSKMNSKMVNEYCRLDADCEMLMKMAFEKFHISARGYTRILKVARTIADLDGSLNITSKHITEALAYRTIDKFQM